MDIPGGIFTGTVGGSTLRSGGVCVGGYQMAKATLAQRAFAVASGRRSGCRSRALAAVALLIPIFCLSLGAVDSRARDRDNWKDYERQSREEARRQQAEMERQRREQEKAQQRAAREAERAQKEAQREAQRQAQEAQRAAQREAAKTQSQNNAGNKQGWNDPGRSSGGQQNQSRQQQGPDQGRSGQNGNGQQANGRNGQGSQDSNNKTPDAKKGDPGADDIADDTNDDDWNLTEAERHVREVERMRQREMARVQREHDLLIKKEQARSERIREHTLRQRERELAKSVDRLPTKPTKPEPVVRAVAVPVSVDKSVDRPQAPEKRPTKFLDQLPSQASHLGMGGNGTKIIPDKDVAPSRGDDRDRRETPVADPAREIVPRPPALPGTARPEQPPAAFDKVRDEELVVTEPSAEDLEKAKANGFTVSEPIELKGTGTKVRRLSAPGIGRDEAERELHKLLPFLPVTPNFAYTIFMGTLGESEGAAALPGGSIGPALTQPCPKNACFGGQLIQWSGVLTSCTKDVRIGVIDTSFDIGHPAFRNLKSVQGEFLNGERPSPSDWHGTAVLSLLAGDPRSGTPGLVPDATFLLATAFRSDANGNASTDTVRLLAALDWLEQLDVDIVNMSFSGPKDPALAKAIERMSKKGVVFIAAAGNMGPTAPPSYPAAYPHVIAVTAVNRNGANYKSANRGPYIDVSAPGVDILTALPNAKQGYRTGTSFAVPFVTAILATKVERTGSEVDFLKQVSIRDLGPPGQDPIYGAGLALAPKQCTRGGGAVAVGGAPDVGSWSSQTTLIKAGAGFAP